MKRDLTIATKTKVGKEVILYGWVNSRRDHGKIIFLDLRDRTGIVQVVASPRFSEAHKIASSIGSEDVIEVHGVVNKRPKENINPELETGEVEIEASEIKIITKCANLPFEVTTDGSDIDETIRLKYRYLDLRRPRMQKNLRTRAAASGFIRNWLIDEGFVEIDTPILSKSTPEGARDFLVPSRLQKGKFYALPQSPQQYKQLLMVAGLERYFQLPHIFRDEDLRGDRQLECIQVDLEMSFVEQDDVLDVVERLMVDLMEKCLGKKVLEKPFPRFSYEEAMKKFGADKFDLRKKKDPATAAFAWVIDFPLFEWKEEEKRLDAVHHPFTSPRPQDVHFLAKEPEKAKAWQYDLVCNGFEVAGGSIRIHDSVVQSKIFEIMGHSKEAIERKFGHLLEAFRFGVPPHGGIAVGFDRLLQAVLPEKNIREVIAFPVAASGQTSVMDAPSEVDPTQLSELGIKVGAPTRTKKIG
ncbi:MAG: hypothetical protein A2126_00345 [Candidatus Woykebacteria bacterium GWB1_45_5]|uniref:Aspartate--tRNA(Asp/Asn) ligase n=2 Tax=Candidatus Woykeibacteriota TaxID=1817899 RepID=A0A1G1W2M3_9BACT|nr:MAG: hypothetical protein A2113_00740 [Candidatus Woykebacteria bacterium GWA1_44_8]OGY22821.1 MAG: hypothetical protein A2126_00345 [Candidatus Woykebacteria bacterium GWB1_45_5]